MTESAVLEQPQIFKPQEGPQERFFQSEADIVIYGGGAGGGKTYAELLEALRHSQVRGFTSVIFRRTFPQITAPGGLWDTSMEVYRPLGLIPRQSSLEWLDPVSGSRIKFAHLQHQKNMYDWQGSQICYIAFDELTHFEEQVFFYMLSRNRSMCGVRPYMRGTCNPDPDSWVRRFISWWIEDEEGYPIPERDGVVRWMSREKGEIIWANTRQELVDRKMDPKSVTFIAANVFDNPILLAKDPGYVASLKALPTHERARLLGGNWNVRAAAGSYFKREMFEIVEAAPDVHDGEVRYWDRAATEINENNKDPDATAGVHMVLKGGTYYVKDVRRFFLGPGGVENAIRTVASQQKKCTIALEQDPGQAGKSEIWHLIRALAGYRIETCLVTKAKEIRARAFSSQCAAGNVKLVRAPWNEAFLSELESFPMKECHDDQVDASSGAFNYLTDHKNSIKSGGY